MNEEIIKEYERTLVIPQTKPVKQFVLCPIGLIGTGKTTVVKALAEKLSLLRISNDEIRHILSSKDLPFVDVNKMTISLARKYFAEGYSIAIDADCASEETQALVVRLDEAGVKPVWIHITAPEDVVLNRLRTTDKTWLFPNAEAAIDNYNARKPLHENLTMPFVYTFKTERDDVSRQIEEAAVAIQNYLS